MYRTWGPSLMRRLEVQLNGYVHCRSLAGAPLGRYKADFFRRMATRGWVVLGACERFAPNGAVRRRIRKLDERYRAILGEPTPAMVALSGIIEQMAVAAKLRETVSPQNRFVKEEPFKRYIYDDPQGSASYRTKWPGVPARSTGERWPSGTLGAPQSGSPAESHAASTRPPASPTSMASF